ncbi:MAG: addiction module antidote protein, HigA family [Deltaproteobacteria bacterium RIFOXYD12_FULL_57_12]|nr:MAG: addiction module antidote protein, HigA family [Deltaproteobacteria bacterium RIFOXYD12_FULL_57_12]
MLPKNRPPTHPGEMLLKEFLEPLGLAQAEFARHLGWPYARLNEIINGKRGVTAASALDLGEALQTGPEFWLNLQRGWDLWHSMKKHKKIPPVPKMAAHQVTA